jgi:cell division initiation protein
MKLTPIDIKKQTFNKALRGYEPAEVEAFLETVSKQWEDLLDELDKAKRKLSELDGEMRKHKEVEGMLHQTLAQAQQSTAAVVENAKREGELIRQEAQLKANQIIDRAKNETIALNDDVQRLQMQKHEVVSKLRMLLSSQLELLNSFSANEDVYIVNQIAARKKLREELAEDEPSKPIAQQSAPVEKNSADRTIVEQPSTPVKSTLNGAAMVAQLVANIEEKHNEEKSSEPQPEKTVRVDVQIDAYKSSSAKRTMNIDDILSGLE